MFDLKKIPYNFNDLAPTISEKTLKTHYEVHYKNGYLKKLNELIKDNNYFVDKSIVDIIRGARQDSEIYNNACQVWNHEFLWECMTPNMNKTLPMKLQYKINKDFGNLDRFRKLFIEECMELFGTGWVWLCEDNEGNLKIIKTEDGGNPLIHNLNPLLTIDLWEHAYYTDYTNKKKEYCEKYFDILVDWGFVDSRLKQNLIDSAIGMVKSYKTTNEINSLTTRQMMRLIDTSIVHKSTKCSTYVSNEDIGTLLKSIEDSNV